MMPNVTSALRRFEKTLGFTIIKKTMVDGDIAESSKTPVNLYFEGTLQPLPPSRLLVKPEGQRSFQWWTLHTEMELKRDWIVKDQNGKKLRVMTVSDWSDAGFYVYELMEGPAL